MSQPPFVRHLKIWMALLSVSVVSISCSKKEATPAAVAEPATAAPAAPAAAAAPAANSPAPVQMNQLYSETDAALKLRNYEQAVQGALALRQQQLTAQQAEAARNQMVRLQNALTIGIGNGDPAALAAAERLRAANRVK
jgi:hypothetical protein